ncbi:alpha/beta-hydrolase [Nemania sp. FL0916]|nr:alpha/beta-hydrolase [Nemania sp. FL0916]
MKDALPETMAFPRRGSQKSIAAPSEQDFLSYFGRAFPHPRFLESDLGVTALYELKSRSGQGRDRHVLLIHGLNTPTLGLLPLAKHLQTLDRHAHIVLYDLWGHGLSSTPRVAHAAHIFHLQIYQVLSAMDWRSAHMVGYSFGASILVQFALLSPNMVSSAALIAPAGLLRKENFSPRLQELMDDTSGSKEVEAEARDAVLEFLEGGKLVVPEDWWQRCYRGQVVAEALRDWQLKEHAGYSHSVLSMFREQNIYGCDEFFKKFAFLLFKKAAVLGELDDICTEDQLLRFGIWNTDIVDGAGHALVRSHAHDVANTVHGMWTATGNYPVTSFPPAEENQVVG